MNVVKVWLSSLTLKQQTVLLSALRGCDGMPKEDPSKTVTRNLRYVLLKDADNTSSFMKTEEDLQEKFKKFIKNIDTYPMHFLFHLSHALEIIGYKHPEEKVRKLWMGMYKEICSACHMYPETEKQLDKRLSDNEVVHEVRCL